MSELAVDDSPNREGQLKGRAGRVQSSLHDYVLKGLGIAKSHAVATHPQYHLPLLCYSMHPGVIVCICNTNLNLYRCEITNEKYRGSFNSKTG